MVSVYISWTDGIDGSVYIDVASSTEGPFNSNSYFTASLSDANGTYLVRPWCGSIEIPTEVSVSGGYASPDRINCNLG
jgi:hypothetical protein